MRLQSVIDYTVYLAVRIFICVVQALPLETCDQIASALATLFCRVIRIRYRICDENIRHAYPELSAPERQQLTWRMWHHLFLMVAEVAHARRKIHRSNWHRHVTVLRDAELVRTMLEPGAKLLVSGHFGNFEVAGYLLGLFGFPTVSVARPLDNPYLDRYLAEFRSGTGQSLLPKQGSAAEVDRLLSEGRTLAILGDQAAGSRGCWIEFFNRPASAHKAIALFSLGNQVPMLVTYCRRVGRPLCFENGLQALADPRDSEYKLGTVPDLTQWYSDRLEEIVNLAPEQYWWLHRRWKGEPPAKKRRAGQRSSQAA